MTTGDETEAKFDGGTVDGLEQAELYTVVRSAVRDALMDILGTVALLGFALLFVAVGGQAAISGSTTTTIALGAGAVVVGFAIAAAALDLVPPFRG